MTKRRDMIVESAMRLFAEKGYDATPVSEIASAAGVSEGAIFRHFKNKEALLLEAFERIRSRFASYLDNVIQDAEEQGKSGMERLISLAQAFCRFFEEREIDFDNIHRNNPYQMPRIGEPCRLAMKALHDLMLEAIEDALERGAKEGGIRFVPARETSILVLGMITGAVRLRVFHPEIHLKHLEANLLAFLGKGLEVD